MQRFLIIFLLRLHRFSCSSWQLDLMPCYQHAIFGTFFYDDAAIKRNWGEICVGLYKQGRGVAWKPATITLCCLSFASPVCHCCCCYCCCCCLLWYSLHSCLIFMGHLRRQRRAACLCIRKIHFRLTIRIRDAAVAVCLSVYLSLSVSTSVCMSECIWLHIYLSTFVFLYSEYRFAAKVFISVFWFWAIYNICSWYTNNIMQWTGNIWGYNIHRAYKFIKYSISSFRKSKALYSSQRKETLFIYEMCKMKRVCYIIHYKLKINGL